MNTALDESFAALLKRYRLAAGLSQEELADRARLSPEAVSALERGVRRTPYRDTVRLLAEALQLSPADGLAFAASVHRRRGPSAAAADRVAEPSTGLSVLPTLSIGRAPEESISRRHVLVGRDRELTQLQRAFEAAIDGHGSLAAIVGEPGIGKTTLAEQLAAYVTARGGRAVVGHSYEPGSLALPYLPFLEALRSYIFACEPDALADQLGREAGGVARVLPELADRITVEPRPAGDPEEDRWRLYQSLGDFLQRAAAAQPLMIGLEDLHWADRGTLDFLVYLSRRLVGTQLLIVVTYRDVEVDRAHPLSSALAELQRSASFQRIPLRGLSADHVQAMVESLAGRAIGRGLADTVHGQTEGNPLFVREFLRYLDEEGLLDQADLVGPGRSLLRPQPIPDGLRDVIGKRLSRLSREANQVLAIAAVLGRNFTFETLQAVSASAGAGQAPQSEESLITALEEAVRGGILEDRSDAGFLEFRFAHALFRQTLYEELFSAKRVRLHRQAARAIEQLHAENVEEHAAELAEHFALSNDPTDLHKAVQYARLAADRAVTVSAYGEAARLLERALQAQDLLDPKDRTARCELLLGLGEVLGPAGEPRRAYEEVAEEAFRLAEASGDDDRAARACTIATTALGRQARAAAWGLPAFRTWAERAHSHSAPGTRERVWADLAVGQGAQGVGEWERGHAALHRAFDGAHALADIPALVEVGGAMLGPGNWWPGDVHQLVPLARELSQLRAEGVSTQALGRTYCFSVAWLLAVGDRPAAEHLMRRATDVADRSRDSSARGFAIANEILFATLDGDFARVQIAGERLRTLGDETGTAIAATLAIAHSRADRYYLGRAHEAVQAYDELSERWGISQTFWLLRRWLYAVHADASASNIAALQGLLDNLLSSIADGRAPEILLTSLLEAAVAVKDRDACARLAPWLAGMSWLAIPRAFNCTAPGRHLGDAARLLGDRKGARTYYASALAATARVHHRPEVALTRLRLAELLLEGSRTERIEAKRFLELAIPELEAMRMSPFLKRARSLQGRARA